MQKKTGHWEARYMEKQNQNLIQNNGRSCHCKKCISWALKTVQLEFGLNNWKLKKSKFKSSSEKLKILRSRCKLKIKSVRAKTDPCLRHCRKQAVVAFALQQRPGNDTGCLPVSNYPYTRNFKLLLSST